MLFNIEITALIVIGMIVLCSILVRIAMTLADISNALNVIASKDSNLISEKVMPIIQGDAGRASLTDVSADERYKKQNAEIALAILAAKAQKERANGASK